MKKVFCKLSVLLSLILASLCLLPSCGGVTRVADDRTIDAFDYTVYNTVAVDSLGRVTLSVDGEKTDKERYVGIFFFIAPGNHASGSGVYDVSAILNEYGRDFFNSDTDISPVNYSHHWGEPVFGYYKEEDPWVQRKQIEMLTMIGVDFLVFDCSNVPLYTNVTDNLFEILLEYQELGWDVPKVMYMMGGGGSSDWDEWQVNEVYDRYYSNERFAPIWFAPNGKPMMVIQEKTAVRLQNDTADENRQKLANAFEFRYTFWPTDKGMNSNAAAWMSYTYPQKTAGDWLSVSVAQHLTVRFSDPVGSHGRGWNYRTNKNEENFEAGINYENQWKTAFENDDKITYTFITQFNEWVACKYYYPELDSENPYVMVDGFNDEFSRDIEPSRTGNLKDNFFLQTSRNIHEYKYEAAKHYIYDNLTPDWTDPSDEAWNSGKTYLDFTGECIERNFLRHDGDFSGVYLTDNSNRNDIDAITVARDNNYLYLKVTAVDDITEREASDLSWMNVWIRTTNEGATNGIGYQYALNRKFDGDLSVIQRANGNGGYTDCGKADIRVSGNALTMRIPLSALKLTKDSFDIEFKVSDNIQTDSDVLDFYAYGDSAPIGGLSYKFGY